MSHSAAVFTAVGAPLQDRAVPTPEVGDEEVQVRVRYVSLSPLDIWRSRHGLLAAKDSILGGTFAGEVLAVGSKVPSEDGTAVGDLVSGYSGQLGIGSHQQVTTVPWWCMSKLPPGTDLAAASTVNDSLISAVWSLTQGGLALPLFDKSPAAKPQSVLVWGGASSVGHFALQLLSAHGFTNVVATASARHEAKLLRLGASAVVDYSRPDAVDVLRSMTGGAGFDAVLDCIGDVDASLAPSLQVVKQDGGVVAAMLPYVQRRNGAAQTLYMDIGETSLSVAPGVKLTGVRTHFHHHDEAYRLQLQPSIIPRLLEEGKVVPPNHTVVGDATAQSLAERMNAALDVLAQGVSGQRVVVAV